MSITYQVGTGSVSTISASNIVVTTHAQGYIESIKVLGQCGAICAVGTYNFVITGLKNPDYVSGLTAGNFTIDTVDSTDGIINRGKNTTSVGVILPHLFTAVPAYDRSVPDLGLDVTLSLNFTTNYVSYQSGFIKLEIPIDVVTFNSSLVPVFTYGSGTALSYSSFTTNSTYYNFVIPNWCSGTAGTTCPAGTTF